LAQTFNRRGAVRYECPPLTDYPKERFTVVAYREADELWVEIRRGRSGAYGVSGDLDNNETIDLRETLDPGRTKAAWEDVRRRWRRSGDSSRAYRANSGRIHRATASACVSIRVRRSTDLG
jgi:hypothetical protein